MLVATPADVIENLNSSLRWLPLLPPVPEVKVQNDPFRQEERPALLNHIGKHPLPVDIIAQRAGLSISDVTVQLVELELLEWVTQVSGGYALNR